MVLVGSGQVGPLGPITLPPEIFALAPWLQFVKDQYEIFRR